MKLTEDEKIILENIDKQYKYITRDMYGDLCIHSIKPEKTLTIWRVHPVLALFNAAKTPFHIFNHLFQEVKWRDKEPLQFRNDKGEFIL